MIIDYNEVRRRQDPAVRQAVDAAVDAIEGKKKRQPYNIIENNGRQRRRIRKTDQRS